MSDERKVQVGELRPSQMMYAFGIGAVIDLPYLSALVMGIDDWPADPGLAHPISEDRLLQAVRAVLGGQVQQLLSPPIVPETAGAPGPFDEMSRLGVPVATFPRWMVCPVCRLLAPLDSGLFELRDDPYHPERIRYHHTGCRKAQGKTPPVVFPARFMVACENGHLDDFPWREYVHRGPTNCRGALRLYEQGPSGEARDVVVYCEECTSRRRLAQAFGVLGQATMPLCRGRRPHLRDYEDCDQRARAILLGASNLWFADVLTTLAIPSGASRLAQLVEEQWSNLVHVQSLQNVVLLRQVGQLMAFSGYSDEEVWRAIEDKRQRDAAGGAEEPVDLKGPEWRMFTAPASAPQSRDFRLRQVGLPEGLEGALERVVLAERLREVSAMIGFTRIDAPGEADERSPEASVRRMRISRQAPAWVPATEVRGEGIFIQFKEQALQQWLGRPAVRERDAEFHELHTRWRRVRRLEPASVHYPGMRYILLHSFAHALMRQFALDCGYAAASVRERIYASKAEPGGTAEPMAGVLIYTAAPDSEGTLGGLVALGEPAELGRHIRAALRDAQLCASDPLCAEHRPSQQGLTLHAAACHACMLAPETSCERGNRYLDRSVLAKTVERGDLAFFEAVE